MNTREMDHGTESPYTLSDALPRVKRRLTFKEPASAWTHFIATFGAIAGTLYLLWASWGTGLKFWSFFAYGIGFIGVFLSSSVYHFFDLGDRWNKWLRRVDHMAIFVMIAGSYIPMLVHFLHGGWRTYMLASVLTIATLGILFKLFWVEAPTFLGVGLYLAMGWMVVVAAPVLARTLSSDVFFWLAVGGLIYSIGALVYAFKWPDPWPETFDHHALWHLFVIGGAAAHFVAMVRVVPLMVPA